MSSSLLAKKKRFQGSLGDFSGFKSGIDTSQCAKRTQPIRFSLLSHVTFLVQMHE